MGKVHDAADLASKYMNRDINPLPFMKAIFKAAKRYKTSWRGVQKVFSKRAAFTHEMNRQSKRLAPVVKKKEAFLEPEENQEQFGFMEGKFHIISKYEVDFYG